MPTRIAADIGLLRPALPSVGCGGNDCADKPCGCAGGFFDWVNKYGTTTGVSAGSPALAAVGLNAPPEPPARVSPSGALIPSRAPLMPIGTPPAQASVRPPPLLHQIAQAGLGTPSATLETVGLDSGCSGRDGAPCCDDFGKSAPSAYNGSFQPATRSALAKRGLEKTPQSFATRGLVMSPPHWSPALPTAGLARQRGPRERSRTAVARAGFGPLVATQARARAALGNVGVRGASQIRATAASARPPRAPAGTQRRLDAGRGRVMSAPAQMANRAAIAAAQARAARAAIAARMAQGSRASALARAMTTRVQGRPAQALAGRRTPTGVAVAPRASATPLAAAARDRLGDHQLVHINSMDYIPQEGGFLSPLRPYVPQYDVLPSDVVLRKAPTESSFVAQPWLHTRSMAIHQLAPELEAIAMRGLESSPDIVRIGLMPVSYLLPESTIRPWVDRSYEGQLQWEPGAYLLPAPTTAPWIDRSYEGQLQWEPGSYFLPAPTQLTFDRDIGQIQLASSMDIGQTQQALVPLGSGCTDLVARALAKIDEINTLQERCGEPITFADSGAGFSWIKPRIYTFDLCDERRIADLRRELESIRAELKNCCLQPPVDWNDAFKVQPDTGLNEWSGGDGAYSIALPPEYRGTTAVPRTLWRFGDSLIGPRTGCEASPEEWLMGLPSHRGPPCQIGTPFGTTIAIQYGDWREAPTRDELSFYWGLNVLGRAPLSMEGQLELNARPYYIGGWLPLFRPLHENLPLRLSVDFPPLPPPIFNWPAHGIAVGADLLLVNHPLELIDVPGSFPFVFVHFGVVATVVRDIWGKPYEQWGAPLPRPDGEMGVWSDPEPAQRVIPFTTAGFLGWRDDGSFNPYVSWGSYFMHDWENDRIYIYGNRLREDGSADLIVARANSVRSMDDLMPIDGTTPFGGPVPPWQFFNGDSWVGPFFDPVEARREALAAVNSSAGRLAPPLTGQTFFSVLRAPDRAGSKRRWALVYGLGSVVVAFAEKPEGPFREGFAHNIFVDDMVTCAYFGLHESDKLQEQRVVPHHVLAHPHLSDDENLLVSFIMNPLSQPGIIIENENRYVPRFLKVPWDWILAASDP